MTRGPQESTPDTRPENGDWSPGVPKNFLPDPEQPSRSPFVVTGEVSHPEPPTTLSDHRDGPQIDCRSPARAAPPAQLRGTGRRVPAKLTDLTQFGVHTLDVALLTVAMRS
ncbi:hypothetical protein GCM10029963_58830 [Micromonospora andamanensis]